jgi:hypothetical protein
MRGQHTPEDFSMLAVAVRYNPKIELLDQRHRFASSAVNSRNASFAVLRFEPTATMPPSTEAPAIPITDGLNWIPPTNMAKRTTPPLATAIRPATIKFAAALDRGLELIDLRLQPHNLASLIVPIHGPSMNRNNHFFCQPSWNVSSKDRATDHDGGHEIITLASWFALAAYSLQRRSNNALHGISLTADSSQG